MNSNDNDVIAAIHGAHTAAIATLAHIICATQGVRHEQIATLFEEQAAAIPDTATKAQLARTALLQMAQSIRQMQPGGESWDDLQRRLRQ